MQKKQRLPAKDSIRYLTVEKIEGGFLLICPERAGQDQSKYYRSTMNGVVTFLEKVFGKKVIEEIDSNNLSNVTIAKANAKKTTKKAKKAE